MKTQEQGKIRALYRYPQKGQPPVSEKTLTLEKDTGILGDCHSDGSDRQISLLDAIAREWMQVQETEGFCFKKFKENILVEGVDIRNWKPGTHVRVGTAEVEITIVQKHCYPELCTLAQEGRDCRLQGSCCFARVVESGTIKAGDKITVMKEK